MEKQDRIPSSISSKLEQIKLYMGTHSVTAFVGSGFSLNAEIPSHVKMKTWVQLKDTFLEKLYPNNEEEKRKDVNDVVRLSSLIEAQFGHNELDNILEDALPDRMVQPGNLHRKLVQLPWKDILTTNYDTLIERAASLEMNDLKLVTNKETLLYQPSPRIIKLHGSFPNIRPYIMTQEDFRRYPIERPEMVNTARQCFLESLVCMLGFSGEDPNFRAWIGWLKDVMGQKRICPTYLVTYNKGFHDAEKALLSQMGIDIINLAEVEGVDSYYTAYEFFFNYLQERPSGWDGTVTFEHFVDKDKSNDEINAYIGDKTEAMKSIRLSYPGWLILPQQHETGFQDVNKDIVVWGMYYQHITNEALKLQFLYEINWRLNIAAVPCNIDWFIKAIEGFMEHMDLMSGEDLGKVAELGLSLIGLYRYIGENEKFDHSCQTLLKYAVSSSRYVYYQQALYALAHYDESLLKNILMTWNEDISDYQNCLQKANILCYTGKKMEAFRMLTQCKESICRSLLQNKDDLYAKSCLTYILQTMRWCEGDKTSVNDNISNFAIGESFEELTNRLCGKAYEQTSEQGYVRVHQFGIGNYTNSWSMGSSGFVKDYLYPYKWWMLKERIGISMFVYNQNYTRYCLQQMFHYTWNMAWNMMMMTASNKIVQEVFGREQLSLLSEEEANAYFDTYIHLFERDEFNGLDWISNKARNILPTVLGRLCTKVSQDRVLKFTKMALTKSPYLVNEALKYAYDCLDDDSLAVVWKLLITDKVWDSHYQRCGYILPDRHKVNFQITENMVNRIQNGLNSTDSHEIYQALMMRNVISWQPDVSKVYKTTIDNAVRQMRNSNHAIAEALYTYASVDVSDEEQKSFKRMLDDVVNGFCETEYKYDQSSLPITNWCNAFNKVNILRDHLTEEEKKKCLLHTYDLIELNKNCFDKDDSRDFFGGIRMFTNQVISIYKGLFLHVNLDVWNNDECHNVATQIDWLIEKGYRCLPMKIKLILKNGQEMNGNMINLIKSALFSKDDGMQNEGINAFFVLQDNGIDVSEILDYIFNVFMVADASVYKELLILFANLVAKGYDKEDFNDSLLAFLNRIHEDYTSYGMELTALSDLKYYVNYVAGVLSAKMPDGHAPVFDKEESDFNDVFIGYEQGKALVQDC